MTSCTVRSLKTKKKKLKPSTSNNPMSSKQKKYTACLHYHPPSRFWLGSTHLLGKLMEQLDTMDSLPQTVVSDPLLPIDNCYTAVTTNHIQPYRHLALHQ